MINYVYIGVCRNQTATFVDIDAAVGGREPTMHAASLLAEHRSCERVEIWRDDERVAVVGRPARSRTQ